MKIVVCIKQVPSVEQVDFDTQTGQLKRESVKGMLNPFDGYALELALELRDSTQGEVTAVTMGPRQADAVLRDALAMGVDRACLLSDPGFAGSDTWATARVLAAAVRKLGGADVVICGRESSDGETGQVGPELSVLLDCTCGCYVSEVTDVGGNGLTARRLTDRGVELVSIETPAVLTVTRGDGEPRPPSLRGMMAARKAEVATWGLADLALEAGEVGLDGSPTRVASMCTPERSRAAELIDGSPEEQARALVERLRAGGLV